MEFSQPAEDLASFLHILPEHIRTPLDKDTNGLVEIVLDLWRKPHLP